MSAIFENRLQSESGERPSRLLRRGLPLLLLAAVAGAVVATGVVSGTDQPLGAASGARMPGGTMQVTSLLDGRPRSVGLRVASGDFDEALARGEEAPVGVVVTHVAPNGTAAAAGFRVGDVIEQMGGRKLDNIEDFEAALFTAEPDSRQAVILVRGRQRGTLQLPIALADPFAPAFQSYTAPGGGYQFDYFPDWKLAPNPFQEVVTDRVYHYLQSTDDNYRLFLYVDSEPAANAMESLEAFRRRADEGFLHGRSGWVLFGDIPAVFASGATGRERLFTLYRLAFVLGERRYEVNLFTPPSNDSARLPFVMETILGTLRRPDPARDRHPEVATTPPLAPQRVSGFPRLPADEAELDALDAELDAFDAELAALDAAEAELQRSSGSPETPPVPPSQPGAVFPGLDAFEAEIAELQRKSNGASAVSPPPTSPPPPPAETRPAPAPPPKLTPMPSVSQINQLRKKAMEVWNPPVDVDDEDFEFPEEDPEPAPKGWAKSEHDPNRLVDLFRPLRLRKGYVLRAYVFRENGNATGVVWAMPEDAEFPEPKDSPTLENHVFNAPKPWDALDDLMEAIEGDGSQWSYLAASMLRRELREFGASWHGIEWGTHIILEDDPWKRPPREDDFPPSRPTTPARDWKWSAARPQQWAPTVNIGPDRVTVTFYTYTGKLPERIFRHTETYRPGRYRARVEDQLIGQGKGGIVF